MITQFKAFPPYVTCVCVCMCFLSYHLYIFSTSIDVCHAFGSSSESRVRLLVLLPICPMSSLAYFFIVHNKPGVTTHPPQGGSFSDPGEGQAIPDEWATD